MIGQGGVAGCREKGEGALTSSVCVGEGGGVRGKEGGPG